MRSANKIETHRSDASHVGLHELMMVAEQVKPRLHRCQDLVYRRLARIDTLDAEWPGRLMREQNIHVCERLARLDFFSHEVTAAVGELCRFRGTLFRMRERCGRHVVHRWRKRAAEASHAKPRNRL